MAEDDNASSDWGFNQSMLDYMPPVYTPRFMGGVGVPRTTSIVRARRPASERADIGVSQSSAHEILQSLPDSKQQDISPTPGAGKKSKDNQPKLIDIDSDDDGNVENGGAGNLHQETSTHRTKTYENLTPKGVHHQRSETVGIEGQVTAGPSPSLGRSTRLDPSSRAFIPSTPKIGSRVTSSAGHTPTTTPKTATGGTTKRKAGRRSENDKIVCPWWNTYGSCSYQHCRFRHCEVPNGIYQRLICPIWRGIWTDWNGQCPFGDDCEFAHMQCKHNQWGHTFSTRGDDGRAVRRQREPNALRIHGRQHPPTLQQAPTQGSSHNEHDPVEVERDEDNASDGYSWTGPPSPERKWDI